MAITKIPPEVWTELEKEYSRGGTAKCLELAISLGYELKPGNIRGHMCAKGIRSGVPSGGESSVSREAWDKAEAGYVNDGSPGAKAILAAMGFVKTQDTIRAHMRARDLRSPFRGGSQSRVTKQAWILAEEAFAKDGGHAALAALRNEMPGEIFTPDQVFRHMQLRQIKAGDTLEIPPQTNREAELRRALVNVQRQLVKAKEKVEDLVTATTEAAREATISLGPIDPVPVPPKDKRKRPEAALWHMTDWQGAKLTTSYNSEVMRERVMRFCKTAATITEIQRADHPVKHCVIAFGGDMVEGLFNFPTQAFEIDSTIFAQYVNVSRLEVDVVRFALSIYETVEVVAEWGNHGRIGSKRDAVPRSDNFDRMTYELSRQLLSDEKRLKWEDCPEDVQRIEIGNYRALLCHGDEVGRNGFASPSTIVQHVNRWKSGAYPWDFRDLYLGHYHTHNEWSLANGEGAVYQTGSTESDNRYAGVMLAASARPTQRLHFIDTERGRVSAQYKIWVGD